MTLSQIILIAILLIQVFWDTDGNHKAAADKYSLITLIFWVYVIFQRTIDFKIL